MNPSIQGYADALLESAKPEETRQLAEEAVAVVDMVRATRQLRAALTDTSIAPAARRAVMDDLLESRVSALTRRATGFAVGAAPAQEVVTALSWVAMETARAAHGQRTQLPRLGRSSTRERLGGYTSALYEDLTLDDLDDMEDALFRFARTVEATPPLRSALTNPDLPAEVRQGVVEDLVAGKVAPVTRRLIGYVVRMGRPRDLVGTLDWLVDRTAAARGWRVARVHSAREIDAVQRSQLAETLARLAGVPVDLEVTIDPRLLGGAVVQIGDLQVDASARGRLERLREHLLPRGWEESTVGAPTPGARAETGPPGRREHEDD